jgi:hypothetical protein
VHTQEELVKVFNLKRMLGLLAIGGAIAYARSKKIDILGKLGLRRGASPDQPSTSHEPTTAAGLKHDQRPETSTPGVGAPRSYAGFGQGSNGGYNRPR